MYKKINIWIGLLIIAIIVALAAWAISVRAWSGIGVGIGSPPLKCVLDPGDPPPGTCFLTCNICGSLVWICADLFQVDAVFLSGTNSLYRGVAFCLYDPAPPTAGSFYPGAQCLGNVSGEGPHTLFNFGCTW